MVIFVTFVLVISHIYIGSVVVESSYGKLLGVSIDPEEARWHHDLLVEQEDGEPTKREKFSYALTKPRNLYCARLTVVFQWSHHHRPSCALFFKVFVSSLKFYYTLPNIGYSSMEKIIASTSQIDDLDFCVCDLLWSIFLVSKTILVR